MTGTAVRSSKRNGKGGGVDFGTEGEPEKAP